MPKFTFRLETLLRHRTRLESDAQLAFIHKQAEIAVVDEEIAAITDRRADLLAKPRTTIEAFKELESEILRVDDSEREQRIIRGVLSDESAVLRGRWVVAKQDLEVVTKLREKALEHWRVETERFEQRELDEWASQRRAA